MSLQITMIKAPESVAVADSPLSLGEQGGTLGRGPDNSWVLQDPELYLSGLHCQFSFENGEYYLTDHSTNGTFYGGSADPLGKGSKVPVRDNDHFVIGDYEFVLSVSAQSAAQQDPFSSQADGARQPAADPFSAAPGSDNLDGFASNPFAVAPVSNDSMFPSGPGDSDPLAALDKARGGAVPSPTAGPSHDPFNAPTHSDGANAMNQKMDWPAAGAQSGSVFGAIPDDWDDDETVAKPDALQSMESAPAPPAQPPAAPQAPAPAVDPLAAPQAPAPAVDPAIQSQQQELQQANAKMQAELDQLKQQISHRPSAASGDNKVDTTFINALGFANHNLSDEEILQINRLAGEVFREMVTGLMQVLGSRNSIKNEFRINVTTIQPVENNPLKFSANVDDALENMFLKQGNAFKKPIESVREGFEGVAEHQVAILAGIREAFKAIIGRFDPITLEENFSKQYKGGLLPGSQKAKNWEAYVDHYQDLAGDIDKSFQYLFGDGFVRAYEDQLQKLAISRKSKKFEDEN